MKNLMMLAVAACFLAACQPDGIAAPTATPTPYTSSVTLPYESIAPTPGAHLILLSASLSLGVNDPERVMAQVESAVAEVGGTVVSSSSWSCPGSPSSASLSARVPPEALLKLRHVALGLAGQVQSDSMSSQDATQDYLRLRERLQDLVLAEKHLAELVTRTANPEAVRSVMLAYQMVTQERTNVQMQIADYDGRASLASFDLSLNGLVPMPMVE
jgi:Domain of unknown function (DUF4349)